jgi:hypothetical protein
VNLVFFTFMKLGDGGGRHVRHGPVNRAASQQQDEEKECEKTSWDKGRGIKEEVAKQILFQNTAVARSESIFSYIFLLYSAIFRDNLGRAVA